MTKTKRSTLTPEEFVRLWQTAASVKDVAAIANCSVTAAYTRANDYRSRGVPLRRFTRQRAAKLDVRALIAVAKELL